MSANLGKKLFELRSQLTQLKKDAADRDKTYVMLRRALREMALAGMAAPTSESKDEALAGIAELCR